MRTVKFNAMCTATYSSELQIPDDENIESYEDLVTYIQDHLEQAPIKELEWLADWDNTDVVTEDDIRDFIDDEGNSIIDQIV